MSTSTSWAANHPYDALEAADLEVFARLVEVEVRVLRVGDHASAEVRNPL